ncbi:MAG: C25 family cysteine peptidase [Candidatus Stygibacter australis]|nr:C25 family cysteine peptidase [Candidatus Stygibacter australis]MDP8320723.1 C25 family cysteine peptidase [Candidatus Stygibacter australis]
MKKNFILVLLTVIFFGMLWCERVDVSGDSEGLVVTYEQSGRGNIRLDFCLDGYESERVEKSGGSYTQIGYEGEGKLLEVGMPDLPVFTRLIAIADAGEVTHNIIFSDYEVIENVMIYPQEELLTDGEFIPDRFRIDEEYYKSGGMYPAESVIVGEPAIMRDLRLVAVTFCPFRYLATEKRLYIYHNISVELITIGEGGSNCRTVTGKPSRAFSGIYESSVMNFAEVANLREDYQRPAILFIHPDNDNVVDNLAYLIDWKEQKGFDVSSVDTGETGTSNTAIKNYIQDAYDNWDNPPEFVVLVGDANGAITIPAWYENWSGYGGIGDLPYSQLAGTDILADVIIGRLSVNNVGELQTIIAKSINYERNPYIDDEDWFQNAGLLTSGGESKLATCQAVKNCIETYNESFTFDEHYTDYQPFILSQIINNGAGYICARCGGGMGGWGYTEISALTNGWMLPFATIITCYTGDFHNNCQSELFVKAGTPTNPKGGIGCVGSATGETSTCINNCITAGIYSGIFADQIFTPGGALVRGKLHLYQQYPQNPNNQVNAASHWNNLMGDPSLELWTSTPQPMSVFFEAEVADGTNWMQISVIDSNNGMPLPEAWVTARGSDYYQTGNTDCNGIYYLDLEGVALSETYELTITCHDKIPFEEEFTIIEAEVNLALDQLIYIDNNDGIPNPGEVINLDLTIANHGSSDVVGISAELVSHNDYVIVTMGDTDLGDVSASGSINNSDLAVEIDSAAPDGITALLDLILTSESETWTIPIFLEISGALLHITCVHVPDVNGVIDPGEMREIYFTIENMGELAVTDVTGELECANHRITVIDSLGEFGSLLPGDEVDNNLNRFMITASSYILPGSQIPVNIHFTNPTGYDNVATYLLEIGIVTQSDPLGADAYGYYCYDDGDTDYLVCPEYDWIEIAESGDELSLNSWGSSAEIIDVDLPAEFTFEFYGVEYDLLTVATSGWISPGGSEVASFMNWMIPGMQGPSPMIAAFWDDLTTQSGDIYTYFDASMHYYIIEWNEMLNYYNNAAETFQIILYDADFYPTATGDSNIKMQYQEFNNVDVGEYYWHSATHGQYCTIGLEDHTGQIGLQYTFNNTYPTAAKPLEDGSAILFTCQPILEDVPFVWLADYSATAGDDGFIESGEDAIIDIVLENIGGVTANAINISISENDEYIEITDATEVCDQLEADEMIELADAFSISVSENVPDFYVFTLNVTIESQEDSWSQLISFTAYHANIFMVDADSIEVELLWGEQTSRSFTLSNTGDLPTNYYIRIDESPLPERDVSGSTITCDTDSFTPGEETTWTFTVYNGSPDNEWICDAWLDFPLGVTVLTASDITGGSGGDMIWDGTTGAGQEVNWHGLTVNEWGVLQSHETAVWEVDVLLSTEFAGDMTIGWEVWGDTYGADPHCETGEIYLLYPLRWINLDTSSGTLEADGSSEITVNFDTSDVEEYVHYCQIVITSDSWDSKTIQVLLTPIQDDNEETELVTGAVQLQNYPNPFNPETLIRYELPEAGNVTLEVYNVKGQMVRNLVQEYKQAGSYEVCWDGRSEEGYDAASGIYLYRLRYGGEEISKRMLLLK